MSACQTPIIVALDFPTRDAALKLADQLDPKLCRVKVGKELFTSCASEIVGTLRDKGFEVFLDLKFHDIPNTTAMAVKAAAEMGVWMVNVHCSGGLRMMAACREVLDQRTGPKPLLIGVTVLTSMEREDLAGIGLDIEPQEQVLRLAALAEKSRDGRPGVLGPGSPGTESGASVTATGDPGDSSGGQCPGRSAPHSDPASSAGCRFRLSGDRPSDQPGGGSSQGAGFSCG